MRTTTTAASILLAGVMLALTPGSSPAADAAVPTSPFAAVHGWWSGEGRLGFREGKQEAVKCKATYRPGATPDALIQSIRCATPSGKVEIVSNLTHADGKLTGEWSELVHNLSGKIEGEVTASGYRVTVASDLLKARMEIIVRDATQIVEIQFDTSLLIGMSLILKKGTSS